MTTYADTPSPGGGPAAAGRQLLADGADRLLGWLTGLWVFSGSFVFTEPSAYELSFVLVLATSLLASGFAVQNSTLGLLILWLAFVPFAIIGAFQTKYTPLADALIFQLVTIFLFFTAYWVANYVADQPQARMRRIVFAYALSAMAAAFLGTLGYLGLIPGHAFLTLYGRARALFNDPNVYAPFLILPAGFALQWLLLGSAGRALGGAIVLLIIAVGVFVSFSRAAWGHFAVTMLMIYGLNFFLATGLRDKLRMLALAAFGVIALSGIIVGLLTIPSVEKLFEQRFASQTYDQGETGRFGRQTYAFELALDNPLGIGPLEFHNLRIVEEPHNTYANVLHSYGWGGGLIFVLFIVITLWRGFSFLAVPSPHRLLLIPLIAVFAPLTVVAAIIDIDHWRHFYLVGGLIWGVTAGYEPLSASRRGALLPPSTAVRQP